MKRNGGVGEEEGLEGKKVRRGEREDASDRTALNRGSETYNEKKKGGKFRDEPYIMKEDSEKDF